MVQADLSTSRGLSLEYDTFGDPNNVPLILIMGLRCQMIHWRPEFCEMLAQNGYYVVRFDNRDCGLSSYLDGLGPENMVKHMFRYMLYLQVNSKYTIEDMAADTIALMDHLQISKAHVAGMSMGGMIAQLCAIHYPDRVISLTSIMSTTGSPTLPGPTWAIKAQLLKPKGTTFDEVYQHSMALYKCLIPEDVFESVQADLEKAVECALKRDMRLDGSRQFCATVAAQDRTPKLATLKCPALVIHGKKDQMLPVANGKATAEAIPGARLHVIENMGHYMASGNWGEIVDAMVTMLKGEAS